MWPVRKPDGSCRLTIDYTALNAVSEKMHPLVTNLATILHEIGSEHCHFTALDISNSFWTCPVANEDQGRFAFTSRGRQWTCSWFPHGFCNSPTVSSGTRIIHRSGKIENDGSVVLQYVDDILIASPTKFKHLTAVQTVLNALQNGGIQSELEESTASTAWSDLSGADYGGAWQTHHPWKS